MMIIVEFFFLAIVVGFCSLIFGLVMPQTKFGRFCRMLFGVTVPRQKIPLEEGIRYAKRILGQAMDEVSNGHRAICQIRTELVNLNLQISALTNCLNKLKAQSESEEDPKEVAILVQRGQAFALQIVELNEVVSGYSSRLGDLERNLQVQVVEMKKLIGQVVRAQDSLFASQTEGNINLDFDAILEKLREATEATEEDLINIRAARKVLAPDGRALEFERTLEAARAVAVAQTLWDNTAVVRE